MGIRQDLFSTVAIIGIAATAFAVPVPASAQQGAVAIDRDDIGGVVRGPNGPEAGGWVIASMLSGICTASCPPGASQERSRANSAWWSGSQCNAALENTLAEPFT